MFDDRNRRGGRVFAGRGHGPALTTRARVGKARLETGVAEGCRAQTHRDARFVHHVEHVGQALAWRPHTIADGTGLTAHGMASFAEVEQRIGHAAITTFVIEPGQRDVVVFAGHLRGRVDQDFWHDE